MPMIELNEKDLLRGQLVTPGWYNIKIESVGEKPSANGESTNYPVEGMIIAAENGDVKFANVPLAWNFNSKAIGFTVGFLEALGVEVKANVRFDLSQASGHTILVFVENDTYQGRMVNRVNHKYRKPAA